MKITVAVLLIVLLVAGCYGVNSETSEIGSYDWTCLTEKKIRYIEQEHSIDKIQDSVFKAGLQDVKNHFLTPKYIVYFDETPKEIIGFDGYSIRVAFNPSISYAAVDGLSPQLSDSEQVRIRNRLFRLLWEKECDKGKLRLQKFMSEPAVFSKEYYNKH